MIANFIGKSDLRPLIVPLRLGENLFSEGLKLDIICSHLKLIDIDVELASKVNVIKPNIWANSFLETCSYLRNSLSELKDDYDLVLIDCPPNANFVVKNALTASNFCIIPAKMDYLSTLGIHQLKDGINEHINEYNRHREVLKNPPQYPELNIELLGIVPTMVNIISTKNGEKQIISTQQKFMTDLAKDFRILPLVRNNGTIFGTAPVDGIPVVLTRPKFYQVTYKQIISELEELGREFLESINPTQN